MTIFHSKMTPKIFSENFCDSGNTNKYFTSTGYEGTNCTNGRHCVSYWAPASSPSTKFSIFASQVNLTLLMKLLMSHNCRSWPLRLKGINAALWLKWQKIALVCLGCPDLSQTQNPYCLVIKTYTKLLRQICFFKHLKLSNLIPCLVYIWWAQCCLTIFGLPFKLAQLLMTKK